MEVHDVDESDSDIEDSHDPNIVSAEYSLEDRDGFDWDDSGSESLAWDRRSEENENDDDMYL
jgi:hypothetical protein